MGLRIGSPYRKLQRLEQAMAVLQALALSALREQARTQERLDIIRLHLEQITGERFATVEVAPEADTLDVIIKHLELITDTQYTERDAS